MIRCIDWNGLQAVEFAKGDYTALVPSVGANLVRLANTRLGVEILRTPAADEIEPFKGRPQVFGLPVLFPPNRIADGRYTFEGRTYQYPITIEKEHNYHHGILKSQPFAVSKALENDDEVLIECRYYANAGNDAIYRDFPHAFKCKITFRLSNEGLAQEIMFANRSAERMPVGVGFHTPMRIPFAGGTDADYVMRVAVGEQVELSARNLPTDAGRRSRSSSRSCAREDCASRAAIRSRRASHCVRSRSTASPTAARWSRTSAPGCAPSTRSTTRRPTGRSGTTAGTSPDCCPEPQSWTTNAPNLADPEAEGFRSIAPGESWRMGFRLYAK